MRQIVSIVCATMNMSTYCLQALGDLALKFGVAADAGLSSTDLVYDRCRTSSGIACNIRDTTARGCSSQVESASPASREGQCGASCLSRVNSIQSASWDSSSLPGSALAVFECVHLQQHSLGAPQRPGRQRERQRRQQRRTSWCEARGAVM